MREHEDILDFGLILTNLYSNSLIFTVVLL